MTSKHGQIAILPHPFQISTDRSLQTRQRFFGKISVLLGLILLGMPLWNPLKAAPKADLWAKWQAHDSQSQQQIDHQEWQIFLQKYVDTNDPSGVALVDYAAVTETDKTRLRGYLAQLAALPISQYNRQAQAAFWINLYNALTVQLILDHFPVDSIVDIDISPGFFSFGPWDAKLVTVEGEGLTLNDIEHRILRPIWQDSRLHYAINCASMGCPNLASVAYTSKNLETLLEQGARAYVNHPRGVDFKGNALVVSKIYEWFQEDFGGNEAGVLAHLKKYASEPLATRLKQYEGDLDFDYDWSLNGP